MSDQSLQPSHEGISNSSSTSISDKSPYLVFTQVGMHWHRRSSLNNLFVFGDSYSSRQSRLWNRKTDAEDPYDTDGDDATWINFFASSLSSRGLAVVKNFAFPGDTVKYNLDSQLADFFDQLTTSIKPRDTAFVFFLGINDCGGASGGDISSLVAVLFDAVQRLYANATARNFILVDVPPTNRSPAGKMASRFITTLASRIEEWNASLVTHASDFVSKNTEATMLVFSSHKVLSEILDNPCAHDFAEDAKDVVGRGIWRDGLHLTPAVHEVIARRVSSVLGLD